MGELELYSKMLEKINPAGNVAVQAARTPNPSANAFGAGIAQSTQNLGRVIQASGERLLAKGVAEIEEQKEKEKAAHVMEGITEASAQLRTRLYDPDTGLYNRTGGNAKDVFEDAQKSLLDIRASVRSRFQTPEEEEAFDNLWRKKSEATLDATAKHEFTQSRAYTQEQKISGLANVQSDAIEAYADPDLLKVSFDEARAIVRSNPDGLSDEGIQRLERETVSQLHVAVIQRMTQDDPGAAADYYLENKSQVSGADHAAVDKFIKTVARSRTARAASDEIIAGGHSSTIIDAVIGAESSGNPDAVSPAGALGLMQVMPDTAREVAVSLGLKNVAGMDDDELGKFFSTPEGQKINKRLGTSYLNSQLKTFDGDLEAALVAYNAGPNNARKWLDAGRDYSALPKQSETQPYVEKVIKAYTGSEISLGSGEGSQKIQSAVRHGASFFQGDAKAHLKTVLQKGKSASHIDGLSGPMADRLASMFDSAPDNVKAGLDILSGARSVEHQEKLWNAALKKYGSVAKARKWVAPPGRSRHNHGNASDLGWNGKGFSHAPPEVKKWVHANAEKFGLSFPLGHEPWHIETADARVQAGKAVKIDSRRFATTQGEADATPEGSTTTVEIAETPTSPGELYTNITEPYRIKPDDGDVNDWLAQAREQYADDPTLLSEVERQIVQKNNIRVAATKKAIDEKVNTALGEILKGTDVSDLDPQMLQEIGAEKVNKLLTVEKKFNSKSADNNITDDATYYQIVKMSPEEFAELNLLDHADKLSRADFQSLADKQAKDARGTGVSRSTDQTRTQIVGSAEDILGLDPNKKPEDAKVLASLNRQLDAQIEQYMKQNNNKEPSGPELQAMVDQLILSGEVEGTFMNSTKSVFELTPEEASNFLVEGVTAEDFSEIPETSKPILASTFQRIFGKNPDEEEAIDLYNDIGRIALGARPEPPANMKPRIAQGLAIKLGRKPSEEEIANTYALVVIRSQRLAAEGK